jgi:hypothetical protein
LAHGKVKPAFMIFQDFITGWPKQSIFIHVISRNYFYVRKKYKQHASHNSIAKTPLPRHRNLSGVKKATEATHMIATVKCHRKT